MSRLVNKGRAGKHFNLVGNHEDGIEADTKASDNACRISLVFFRFRRFSRLVGGQFVQKGL